MFVDDFLECIQDGQWDQAWELRGATLQELEGADPDHVDPRVDRLRELASQDKVKLQTLLADWDHLCSRAESAILEAEFRRLMSHLKPEEWESELYLQIMDTVAACQEGNPERLQGTVEEVRQLLDSCWDEYSTMSVGPEEVTAETMLGHKLLEESLDLWHTALDQMLEASEGGGTWGPCLRTAEHASRRLAAVQLLNRRVASQSSKR